MSLTDTQKTKVSELKGKGYTLEQIMGYFGGRQTGRNSAIGNAEVAEFEANSEQKNAVIRTLKDVPSDIMETGKGMVKQTIDTAKDVGGIVMDKDFSLQEKGKGVFGRIAGGAAGVIGEASTGIGKLFLTPEAEASLKGIAVGVGQGIAGTDIAKGLSGWYKGLDKHDKLTVDSAGGVAALASELLGFKGGGAVIKKTVAQVRKLTPDLDTPHFQESEQFIAGGVDSLKGVKTTSVQAVDDIAPTVKPTAKTEDISIGDTALNTLASGAQKLSTTFTNLRENISSRMADSLDRTALRETAGKSIPEVDAKISDMYINAVSPGVKGKKKTLAGFTSNMKSSVSAIRNIVASRDTLSFRDIDTNNMVTGELPTNLWEFGGAITHQKAATYKQVLDKLGATAKEPIDSTRIVNAMQEVVDDPVFAGMPEVRARAENVIKQYTENAYTPEQVDRLIQLENDRLQAFYRGSGNQGDSIVSAMVANHLRDVLDETVEQSTGEGVKALKAQYGALKAIEQDVVHRALHNAQAREGGLIDMFNIRSAGDIAQGMAGDVGALKRGTAEIAQGAFLKALNDRDALVRRMFLVAEQSN